MMLLESLIYFIWLYFQWNVSFSMDIYEVTHISYRFIEFWAEVL